MTKYYETVAFERFYDDVKRWIASEHDSIPFTDDTRAIYAKVSSALEDIFDDITEELDAEMTYFNHLGAFKDANSVFDGVMFKPEVIAEASRYGGQLPATSDAAGVYHVSIIQNGMLSDFDLFYGIYNEEADK